MVRTKYNIRKLLELVKKTPVTIINHAINVLDVDLPDAEFAVLYGVIHFKDDSSNLDSKGWQDRRTIYNNSKGHFKSQYENVGTYLDVLEAKGFIESQHIGYSEENRPSRKHKRWEWRFIPTTANLLLLLFLAVKHKNEYIVHNIEPLLVLIAKEESEDDELFGHDDKELFDDVSNPEEFIKIMLLHELRNQYKSQLIELQSSLNEVETEINELEAKSSKK